MDPGTRNVRQLAENKQQCLGGHIAQFICLCMNAHVGGWQWYRQYHHHGRRIIIHGDSILSIGDMISAKATPSDANNLYDMTLLQAGIMA